MSLQSGEMVNAVNPIDLQLGRLTEEQKTRLFQLLGFDEARLRELYREYRSGVTDPYSGQLMPAGLEHQFGLIGFVVLSTRELEKIPSKTIGTNLGWAEIDVDGKKRNLSLSVDPFVSGGELGTLTVKTMNIETGKETNLKLKREKKEVRKPIRRYVSARSNLWGNF
jgi:hypothetical protein